MGLRPLQGPHVVVLGVRQLPRARIVVDRAIELSRDVFAFSAHLHALHDPALELFSGVGICERFQDKTALVMPFSEGTVELLVPVVDFGFWTLLAIPRGEGAVDPNGFNQVSGAVPVDVLQAPSSR